MEYDEKTFLVLSLFIHSLCSRRAFASFSFAAITLTSPLPNLLAVLTCFLLLFIFLIYLW